MRFAIVQNTSLFALLSLAVGGEAIRLIKKQTVVTQGGLTLTTPNNQSKTIDLRAGDLAAGTYKYVLTVQNGIVFDMTVHDGSSKVYADSAPGWGWSSMYNPNEIAFTLNKATKGVAFSASTSSQGVSFDYRLVLKR